jgi:hypothetical protein
MTLLRDHEVLRMCVGRLADLSDRAIEDEIDRFFLSHEDRWKKWGFVVEWCEQHRSYSVAPDKLYDGVAPSAMIFPVLLKTIQEVDDWIVKHPVNPT